MNKACSTLKMSSNLHHLTFTTNDLAKVVLNTEFSPFEDIHLPPWVSGSTIVAVWFQVEKFNSVLKPGPIFSSRMLGGSRSSFTAVILQQVRICHCFYLLCRWAAIVTGAENNDCKPVLITHCLCTMQVERIQRCCISLFCPFLPFIPFTVVRSLSSALCINYWCRRCWKTQTKLFC